MIQNFRPNLNRQINSYVSKLFPSGIIPKDMKYAVQRTELIYPDDDLVSKTFGF